MRSFGKRKYSHFIIKVTCFSYGEIKKKDCLNSSLLAQIFFYCRIISMTCTLSISTAAAKAYFSDSLHMSRTII